MWVSVFYLTMPFCRS